MQRLRFYDIRTYQRFPSVLGFCANDTPRLAAYVNASQRRLVYAREAGEEGWWGSWAEIAFNLDPSAPAITFDSTVARVQAFNVCNRTVPIQNQFYEYLQFGNGRTRSLVEKCPGTIQWYSRNNGVTFREMTGGPQFIQVFASDPADTQQSSPRRVLLQGFDNNGIPIHSQDGLNQVQGNFLTLQSPFVQSPTPMLPPLTGIQKDVTVGQVTFFAVDPISGNSIYLLTMQPAETTAWYRRYVLTPTPAFCCNVACNSNQGPPNMVQVTAIVKLELLPVAVDTDYLLIQNIEAVLEEACAVRYSEMDTVSSKQLEAQKHKAAIGLLNGELTHYLGKDEPAVNFAPFGDARLFRRRIGSML
jgi:hypothetical protein